MKRLLLALSIGCLSGCMVSATPEEPQKKPPVFEFNRAMEQIPTLAPVPAASDFDDGDGVVGRSEAKAYYEALGNYHTYLSGYIDYINIIYDLEEGSRLGCLMMSKMRKVPMDPLPDMTNQPDEKVVDILTYHIYRLRKAISDHNEVIEQHNAFIDKYCS